MMDAADEGASLDLDLRRRESNADETTMPEKKRMSRQLKVRLVSVTVCAWVGVAVLWVIALGIKPSR